jgi:hypothetical protein
MTKFKTLALLFAAALAFVGCSENGSESGRGRASVALSADDSAIELSRASLGLSKPAAADFALTISDASGNVVSEWNSIADYDESTLYNVGNYSAKATYGKTSVEAFETPCFEGTKEFAIIDDQTTEVRITAYVANAVVKIDCTDAFKNYFTNYSFTLTTAAGTEIPFVAGETRRAFIDPYTFSVAGSATTQTGSTVKISKSFSNIVAKTLYTVKFDVNSGAVGSATVTISFNDEPVAEIPVDIELNDNI